MNSIGLGGLLSIILEEQAPTQALFPNDSPWSFLIGLFAMHGDAGANFEQFPFAIFFLFIPDVDIWT
jgi:hypothetical protein